MLANSPRIVGDSFSSGGTVAGNLTITGTLTSKAINATGAVTITSAATANFVPLTIAQNDTTNNPNALNITNTGTGIGLNLASTLQSVTGNAITAASQGNAAWWFQTSGTEHGIYLQHTSATPNTNRHLLLLEALNTTGTAAALCILDNNTTGTNGFGSVAIKSSRVGIGALNIGHIASTNISNPSVVIGSNAANGSTAINTQTITGTVSDGMHSTIQLSPSYTAATAQTVTRHNYLDLPNVVVAGAGPAAVTDAAVMRFNAAAGTHKAVDSATTKTTPGGVDAWIKINVNGTLYYVPAYTSKTA